MDHIPEDIDAFVESAKRIEGYAEAIQDDEIEAICSQLAEWAEYLANQLVASGKVGPLPAISMVGGLVSGALAVWYDALPEADDE